MRVIEDLTPAELLAIPGWSEDALELRKRGIVPVECLKPPTVFCTSWFHTPQYVVKLADATVTEEADICEYLQQDPTSCDYHIIPFDIVHSHKTWLVMPYLPSMVSFLKTKSDGWFRAVLEFTYQLLQGTDYLHRRCIAHMDICTGNLVVGTAHEAGFNDRIFRGQLYIIDFDRSQRLPHGPGKQGAIPLPPTQTTPPPGITCLDPYSWDIYCVGRVLELLLETTSHETLPWFSQQLVWWLKGDEQGCTGVCRCRPTARKALWVVNVVRWRGLFEEYAEFGISALFGPCVDYWLSEKDSDWY